MDGKLGVNLISFHHDSSFITLLALRHCVAFSRSSVRLVWAMELAIGGSGGDREGFGFEDGCGYCVSCLASRDGPRSYNLRAITEANDTFRVSVSEAELNWVVIRFQSVKIGVTKPVSPVGIVSFFPW